MATKPRSAIHVPKNRLSDAQPCTNSVQSGSVDRKWRDAKIIRFHVAGKSNGDIAKLMHVHRNTVAQVIKRGATPKERAAVAEVVKLEELDSAALLNMKAFLADENPAIRLDATKFYLTRRSILGEQAEGGQTISINIIEAEREKKLATGLARFGVVVPTPGEN